MPLLPVSSNFTSFEHLWPLLQVHAKNKPIDRSNDDAVLRTISELAIGFSGAELANLLNEGAILAVRGLLRCFALRCVAI